MDMNQLFNWMFCSPGPKGTMQNLPRGFLGSDPCPELAGLPQFKAGIMEEMRAPFGRPDHSLNVSGGPKGVVLSAVRSDRRRQLQASPSQAQVVLPGHPSRSRLLLWLWNLVQDLPNSVYLS